MIYLHYSYVLQYIHMRHSEITRKSCCIAKTIFLIYFPNNLLEFSLFSLHQTVRSRFVVVVVLLFYVHGKHLRSCRDGQLT